MKKDSTLKDAVYAAVLDGIIKDEYKPGQIITEKDLAEKHGVSKAPVREALTALCSQGVLQSIPRCGYQIVALTTKDIYEILTFRSVLEKVCLRTFCGKLTEGQLAELEELNRLCCDADTEDDMWAHWDHNAAFHLKLASYAENNYIYKELERSMDILRRAYAQHYWDKWTPTEGSLDVKSHKQLINALREGNLMAAEIYLEADIGDFGV